MAFLDCFMCFFILDFQVFAYNKYECLSLQVEFLQGIINLFNYSFLNCHTIGGEDSFRLLSDNSWKSALRAAPRSMLVRPLEGLKIEAEGV